MQIRKAYRSLAHIASQQQRFEDAVLAMKALLKLAKDKSARADAYKDIGILYLRQANLNAVRMRVCECARVPTHP
jgi:hypothetical protein